MIDPNLITLAEEWEAEAADHALAKNPRRAWYLEQIAGDLRAGLFGKARTPDSPDS